MVRIITCSLESIVFVKPACFLNLNTSPVICAFSIRILRKPPPIVPVSWNEKSRSSLSSHRRLVDSKFEWLFSMKVGDTADGHAASFGFDVLESGLLEQLRSLTCPLCYLWGISQRATNRPVLMRMLLYWSCFQIEDLWFLVTVVLCVEQKPVLHTEPLFSIELVTFYLCRIFNDREVIWNGSRNRP